MEPSQSYHQTGVAIADAFSRLTPPKRVAHVAVALCFGVGDFAHLAQALSHQRARATAHCVDAPRPNWLAAVPSCFPTAMGRSPPL
ncbi:hypothetical protein [Rubidibacter lacunae]|uniref:hypothetical protein n=1 Tax=Rubidibacter lacunae TaxID=582514 RepID=UPI0012EBB6BF|nr:hypothetical protein [Rubidibacter lacunae]